MTDDELNQILTKENAAIVAPAGHGKTEMITEVVEKASGKQLVLTHTNAGVYALEDRLRKRGVSTDKFHVSTIASYCQRWCQSYRLNSNFWFEMPRNKTEICKYYQNLYEGMINLLVQDWVGKILKSTYTGIIVDEYQLLQARLCGASAVLLIASVLDVRECRRLMAVARELGMEVLLELHGEDELSYAGLMPDVCGVNNRNLGTFVTDVDNSFRLVSRLPEGMCKVSESGISTSGTMVSLRRAGFNGFLIGESFMKAERPGKELRRYVDEVERLERERAGAPFYIKVCGLSESGNACRVMSLGVDMVGFIFHEGSRRHVSPAQMDALHADAAGKPCAVRRPLKVGVFVDARQNEIVSAVKRYGLDCVQMHGNESVGQLAGLRNALDAEAKRGVKIIKALGIATREDVMQGVAYAGVADMLLFDAKGKAAGGTGKRFDWSLLDAYDGSLPFILSGGIGPESVAGIAAVSHPKLAGIDLNSRFETAPGVKDVEALARFIGEIKALRK